MLPSADQKNAFYKQGYFVIPRLFPAEEITEIQHASERLQYVAPCLSSSVEQVYKGSKFFFTPERHLKRIVWCGAAEPLLLQYGRSEQLTAVAGELLESKYIDHLINQMHLKLPHDGVLYPFHQDSTHRRYGTAEWIDSNGKGSYVQAVTAVDEVTLENGPLLFIRGSCSQGHLRLPYDEHQQTVSEKFNPAEAVAVLMQPGDTVFFGPYTIHGSMPNTSLQPRRVFINGFAYPGANQREYHGAGKGVRIEA